MFKGLARLVPGAQLKLTIIHPQSATKHSVSVHKGQESHSTANVAMTVSSKYDQ